MRKIINKILRIDDAHKYASNFVIISHKESTEMNDDNNSHADGAIQQQQQQQSLPQYQQVTETSHASQQPAATIEKVYKHPHHLIPNANNSHSIHLRIR
jgi:spore germination cell wall hydrolase CwlJ-like protein